MIFGHFGKEIFFSKNRLNWGKYEILKIWWIWKIEIWSEELVDGYKTVPHQPGALWAWRNETECERYADQAESSWWSDSQLTVKGNKLLHHYVKCLAYIVRAIVNPVSLQIKPVVTHKDTFFPRFASNLDWFTKLSVFFVIGQSDYSGYVFTPFNWKQLYPTNQSCVRRNAARG